mmetsp:Transcript_33003/g.93457  ORF Transcript_33003/g.93457 Transcript_33003/m.93457 type:complete len:245 (+) Transcript_33003:412-1146(+)
MSPKICAWRHSRRPSPSERSATLHWDVHRAVMKFLERCTELAMQTVAPMTPSSPSSRCPYTAHWPSGKASCMYGRMAFSKAYLNGSILSAASSLFRAARVFVMVLVKWSMVMTSPDLGWKYWLQPTLPTLVIITLTLDSALRARAMSRSFEASNTSYAASVKSSSSERMIRRSRATYSNSPGGACARRSCTSWICCMRSGSIPDIGKSQGCCFLESRWSGDTASRPLCLLSVYLSMSLTNAREG